MKKHSKDRLIQKALDVMALALVSHNHKWTNEERRLYSKAIKTTA